MLACLPASRDPTITLLSRTQMNTGLQKWETTQKMRSASYPTPAELDAYAKKVANSPLTIQIFPNSVKVPQRKHIRRTVNGLDTSSSSQRHSPYPSQVSASGGLLAVLRAPAKGVIKESDGSRVRHLHKAVMNPHGAPYATPSTLNLPQPAPHLQAPTHPAAMQQNVTHTLTLQPQSLAHHQGAPQRSVAHHQALTLTQQRPAPPAGLTHGPGQSCPSVVPQQHLSHLQTLKHQAPPPPPATQDLRHLSDGAQLQPLPQASMSNSLQPPPPGAYGPRKLPDADAPPNVTVSTSTIPLSMAASLHQNRPSDLSSIVHQINQLCQARAGMGGTSVCEGQIANPSPISRNLLINASSRVSSHHPALGLMVGPADKAAQTPSAALHPQPNTLAAFHTDTEKVQLQQQQLQHHLHQQKQQQQHLQQLQQQQRSWAQHQLAHMQQPPEGAHPCKNPRMEAPGDCAFPSRPLGFPHKLPGSAQPFPLKHPADKARPPSPVNCPVGSLPYMNSHYMQPPWGSGTGPGPQDLPVAFQGGQQPAASADRVPGAKYRPGKDGPGVPAKMMHNVDFLGGDFQMPGFQEQSLDVMEKMHRSAMAQVQEPSNGGAVHAHHPGYR